MASPTSTAAERPDGGTRVLERLCELYESELLIYDQVRDLSRRQADEVAAGAGMPRIRELLQQKKTLLDRIAALEERYAGLKIVWERRRHEAGTDQARLQKLLREAGARIEEILGIEAEIDRMLIDGAAAGE